jgi:protein-S-isoprenylcysteine O-methyltransferase Ste14
MKFAQRVFAVAGIYGIIALFPMYFMEIKIGTDSPPWITHPEFFYGFIGVALAWQVAFLMIARDPLTLRWMMIPGALEKLSFFGAVMVLIAKGRVSGPPVAGAMADLIFATLFLVAFRRLEKKPDLHVLEGNFGS